MSLILILIVILLLTGLPYGGYYYGNRYSQPYGGGGLGLIVAIVAIYLLLTRHVL